VRVQDRQPTHVIAYRNARQSGEQSDMEEEDTSAADDQQVAGRYGQNRPELIQFNNGSLRLYGALWKPAGRGPFPAVIYNHGSDPKPNIGATSRGGYGNIGRFYSQHGFVCLIPLRRGHTFRQGQRTLCTSDGVMFDSQRAQQANANQLTHDRQWMQMQMADNEDVVAAVSWIKTQTFVDPNRLVMSGISFGGIQTLLAASKGLGVKGFVPFAPGAMSWRGVPGLHEVEAWAIRRSPAPVFLIQASNDYNTGPSQYLGPYVDAKGPPSRHKLYPAFHPEMGPKAGHGGFATSPEGIDIWSPDVLSFIDQVIYRRGAVR